MAGQLPVESRQRQDHRGHRVRTERLAIEIDGWAWHHSPDRFQRDRAKQNQLVGAGWTVLRFTWFDLTNRPDDVIRQVRAALDNARSAR